MEIIENKKNAMLHRHDVVVALETQITPSKQEVSKKIADHFKKGEDHVVIEKIDSKFGTKKTLITAKVYDSLDHKNKIEVIPRKVKKKLAKEAAEAAAKGA